MKGKGGSSKHGVNKAVYPKPGGSTRLKKPSTAGAGLPRQRGRRAKS